LPTTCSITKLVSTKTTDEVNNGRKPFTELAVMSKNLPRRIGNGGHSGCFYQRDVEAVRNTRNNREAKH
jgi:hypothetical protein